MKTINQEEIDRAIDYFNSLPEVKSGEIKPIQEPIFESKKIRKKKRRSIKKFLRRQVKMKRCKYCKNVNNLTIDHKIPVTKGGKDELANFQVLCAPCNSMKSGLTDKEVRRIFYWFLKIQEERIRHGKKPYTLQ